MTPDPEADAALDVWRKDANWLNERARMRRVLDAHDVGKRAVAFADKALEGNVIVPIPRDI